MVCSKFVFTLLPLFATARSGHHQPSIQESRGLFWVRHGHYRGLTCIRQNSKSCKFLTASEILPLTMGSTRTTPQIRNLDQVKSIHVRAITQSGLSDRRINILLESSPPPYYPEDSTVRVSAIYSHSRHDENLCRPSLESCGFGSWRSLWRHRH